MAEGDDNEAATSGMPPSWVVKVGLALILVFTAGVALWVLLDVDTRSGKREDAHAARSEYAEVRPRCVGSETFRAMLECMVEEAAANHEQRHNEADLKAQDDVAGATVGLFWLGVIGVGISAVGIWFLYANLQAVRDEIEGNRTQSNADAERIREQSKRELRAYLSADRIRVEKFGVAYTPVFRFNPLNAGATPARRVQSFAVGCCSNVGDRDSIKIRLSPALKKVFLKDSEIDIGPKQHVDLSWSPDNPLSGNQVDAVERGSATFLFFGVLRYYDIFGDRHWTIFKCYVSPVVAVDGEGLLSTCRKHNRAN